MFFLERCWGGPAVHNGTEHTLGCQ